MKTIKIDKYEFEYPEGIENLQLHAIVGDRIVGSFMQNDTNTTIPITFTLDGHTASGTMVKFNLIPYDKHKELKRGLRKMSDFLNFNNKSSKGKICVF